MTNRSVSQTASSSGFREFITSEIRLHFISDRYHTVDDDETPSEVKKNVGKSYQSSREYGQSG